jgi:type II secretory pathway pseudopilin PulG
MRNRLWNRLLRGPRSLGREDGFTLVELTVATGVVLTALVMLGGVLTNGVKATGLSRERQSATGLANQTLEQIRALPFDTMARGLDRTDIGINF